MDRATVIALTLLLAIAPAACKKPTCPEAREKAVQAWRRVSQRSYDCLREPLRPGLESDGRNARGKGGTLAAFYDMSKGAEGIFANPSISWRSTGQVERAESWGAQFEMECPGLYTVVKKATEARQECDAICR